MKNDLISREALKKKFERLVDETIPYGGVAVNDMRELIDNAPTVKPCENCDFYFKAMTKEEMKKGGVVYAPELYQGCLSCDAHNRCSDAFCSNAVNCNAYGKGGAE